MTFLAAAGAALWLGILTSISPCPLASNIAAVSFVAQNVASRRRAVLTATAYVLGRAFTYSVLAALVTWGLLSVPGLSGSIERVFSRLLGPLLILLGMLLTGLLSLNLTWTIGSDQLRMKAGRGGYIGAFFLGALFALSLCPVAAALFFGSLLPLSLTQNSPLLLPLLYGVGTGLPVLVIGFLLALGASALGTWMNRIETFQKWAMPATGLVFIASGLWMTWTTVFAAL